MLEEDIERMVRETAGKWGRVDYAVNAAGISHFFSLFIFFHALDSMVEG